MPGTGFVPCRDGFHFANAPVPGTACVPGFGALPTRGWAGGMAFAALDYWFAGLPVPTHRAEDFGAGAGGLPPPDSRLGTYLRKRNADSFAARSARDFVRWSLAPDFPSRFHRGVVDLTVEEQLPRLRRSLDAGRPVVLGLVAARALDDDQVIRNHQMVAYAYGEDPDSGALRVHAYDPDRPGEQVVLGLEPKDPRLAEAAGGVEARCWRGCFVQDYVPEQPAYVDLAVSKGIWVSAWTPLVGQHFMAQFTARNYGDHPARLAELCLALRGPGGERLDETFSAAAPSNDPLEGAAPARPSAPPLEPGAERAVVRHTGSFGALPGSYRITAAYRSEGGHLLALPPGEPGTVAQVGVTAAALPRPTLLRVRFLQVTVDDAAAIGGRLTLELGVNGQAARWPADGAVSCEDGQTLDLDVRFELALGPAEPLTVTVSGPCGRLREHWLGFDGWGQGTHRYRSRLRDDSPDPVDGAYTIAFAIEATAAEDAAGHEGGRGRVAEVAP